jgi:hypothetical protein
VGHTISEYPRDRTQLRARVLLGPSKRRPNEDHGAGEVDGEGDDARLGRAGEQAGERLRVIGRSGRGFVIAAAVVVATARDVSGGEDGQEPGDEGMRARHEPSLLRTGLKGGLQRYHNRNLVFRGASAVPELDLAPGGRFHGRRDRVVDGELRGRSTSRELNPRAVLVLTSSPISIHP